MRVKKSLVLDWLPELAARSQASSSAGQALCQGAWNMAYLALIVIAVAVIFNRRNSCLGYWLNLWRLA